MNRVTIVLMLSLFSFLACRQDGATTSESDASAAEVESTAQSASSAGMQINGFNYLTDCDSLVLSKLLLSGPNGEGDFAYLKGECVTGKSFELLLVPKAGATPATEFGDVAQVLASARQNNFNDYLCYAFELPKVSGIGESGTPEISDLFPINAVIKRLDMDNSIWVRLGQDRAEDLSAYNTLRWNILHDKMPQYD